MKKLLTLLVLLGVAGLAGYAWYLQSVHYVIIQLKEGIQEPDLEKIERHADLDRVAEGIINFGQASAEAAAADAAGSLGRDLVRSFSGLLRGVGEPQAKEGLKDEIRATIAEGKARELLGPFEAEAGYEMLAGVDTPEEGVRRLTLVGRCEGGPAEMEVDFERAEGGPYGLPTWTLVGMSEESARRLAKTCRENAKVQGESEPG